MKSDDLECGSAVRKRALVLAADDDLNSEVGTVWSTPRTYHELKRETG